MVFAKKIYTDLYDLLNTSS